MLAVGLEDGTVILSVGGVLKTGKLSMAGPVDAISFSHDLSSLLVERVTCTPTYRRCLAIKPFMKEVHNPP